MLTLAFVLSVLSMSLADPNPDQELLNKGLKYAAECAAKDNIKYDVCLQMFKDGVDLSASKYDKCKCWIPCVAKKMKAMSEDGKFDFDVMQGYVDNLKTPSWKEEANKVFPICKTEKGENCEGGFNMFSCVMKNSDKAKTMAMKLVKNLSGGS